MKYRIEISEESLRIIGLAVDEYMRLRMGQFDALAEDLTYDGVPRVKTLTGKYTYDTELQSGAATSKICLRLPTKWLSRRVATVDGSTIHGERVSTLYTPSSTSSGWIPRGKSENPPGRQIAPASLSRWGMSRSRRLRGWKNELPVL